MPRRPRPPRSVRDVTLFLVSFLIGLALLVLVVIGPTRDARLAGWVLLMIGCLWPIARTPSFRDRYVLLSTILSFAIIGLIALHESHLARAWLAAGIVFVSSAQNRVRNWRELQDLRRQAERDTLAAIRRQSSDLQHPGP